MTEWSNEFDDGLDIYRPSLPRKIFVRAVPALAAFSFSAAVALRLAGGLASQAIAPQPPEVAKSSEDSTADRREGKLAAAAPVAIPHVDLASGPVRPSLDRPRNPFGGLFDPEGEDRGMPALTAQTDPVGPAFSPLQSEPLFTIVDAPEAGVTVAQADNRTQAETQAAAATAPNDLKPSLAPVQTASLESSDASSDASFNAPLPPTRPQDLAASPVAPDQDSSQARAVVAPLPPRRDLAMAETPAAAPHITPPEAAPPAAGPTRAAARRLRNQPQAASQQALAANDPRSFFDKLFHAEPEQRGPQLAYASPGGGGLFGLGGSFPSTPAPVSARGGVAVYDISAHTVYLPNGQALEAHSGLGEYFDNPSFVHVKMRGPTPPATYRLSLRESLFHGVQALRLTPLDSGVHGRVGLLAHTFMLGARGDSNGCVSFRNYRPFLEAYMRGEISQLKVVASR